MGAGASVSIPNYAERRRIGFEVLGKLAERFPKAFRLEDKRPLMVGVYYQLRARCPDISARHLFFALHEYMETPSYQSLLVEGARRVSLNGNPAGVVTEAEAERAREALDKMSRGDLT